MPIEINTVLSLLGGVPHQKAGTVYAEKLKIAKVLDGGSGTATNGQQSGMGGLLSSIAQGTSLSTLLQDPTASANSQLSSSTSNGASAINTALGAPAAPLVNAMTGSGGLTTSLHNLAITTGGLSGIATPATGQFGPLDLINHDNLVSMLGPTPPSNLSMETAALPLNSTATLLQINSELNMLVSNVISGSMTITDATNQIFNYTSQIESIYTNSISAMQIMQNAIQNLAALNALGSSIASGSPVLQGVVQLIASPSTYAIMQESLNDMTSEQASADSAVSYSWGYYQSPQFISDIIAGEAS